MMILILRKAGFSFWKLEVLTLLEETSLVNGAGKNHLCNCDNVKA